MPYDETLTAKVLSHAAGRPVRPGEVVTVEVDRVLLHDGSAPVVALALEHHGFDRLDAADRAVVVFDHYFPPANEREAALHATARAFTERYGIPRYEGKGISHQLLPELGLVPPGGVLVGADSHSCTAGAFGAFATGMGATDVAGVLASSRLWLEVPEVYRIHLRGTLPSEVTSHDLTLHVVGRVGSSGALGRSIEFEGPAALRLDMPTRMKLCNHAVEMGAVAGMFAVDETSLRWSSARGADLSRAPLVAAGVPGEAAAEEADLVVDLAGLEPLTAHPSRPDATVPLRETKSQEVHQVFIGSCAGGRLEDLREAAARLRGHRVHPNVRLLVGPASQEVLEAALAEGLLAIFVAAGAVVLPPGCGACMGRLGTLAPDEVEVANQNRNFVGRAGSPRSKIFLTSAGRAAEAALTGVLGGKE